MEPDTTRLGQLVVRIHFAFAHSEPILHMKPLKIALAKSSIPILPQQTRFVKHFISIYFLICILFFDITNFFCFKRDKAASLFFKN